MIEIDSSIIDPKILLDRVKMSAKSKNIPQEFWGESNLSNIFTERTNLSRIYEEMNLVYQNLQMMNATWVIEEKPLASVHPIVGKWIVLFKRVYRKLTRWLFQTYYQQQTNFNGAATRTISDMIRVQELLIQAYEEEIRRKEKNAN